MTGMVDLLLRDREQMLARIRTGEPSPILRAMVLTIVGAMAVFGAALGSYRGGIQIAYAAVKLPLVLLGTAALSAPVLTAVGASLGRRVRMAEDLALVMSALAFGALVLAACTPLVLLGRAADMSYHAMTLAMVGMFAFAGLCSLRMVVKALGVEGSRGGMPALATLCVVFALVGGQLSWALRPYLVRPRSREVVFIREREGSLVDAVVQATSSARGIYHRDFAPVPE